MRPLHLLIVMILLLQLPPAISGADPGPILSATVDRATYSLGEPIMVRVILENTGRSTVTVDRLTAASLSFSLSDGGTTPVPAVLNSTTTIELGRSDSVSIEFELQAVLCARLGHDPFFSGNTEFSVDMELGNIRLVEPVTFNVTGEQSLDLGASSFRLNTSQGRMDWELAATSAMCALDTGDQLVILAAHNIGSRYSVSISHSPDGVRFSSMERILELGQSPIRDISLMEDPLVGYRMILVQGTGPHQIVTSTSTDLAHWTDPVILLGTRVIWYPQVRMLPDGRYLVAMWERVDSDLQLEVLQSWNPDRLSTANQFLLFSGQKLRTEPLLFTGDGDNATILVSLISPTYNGLFEFHRNITSSWDGPFLSGHDPLVRDVLFERRSPTAAYNWSFTDRGIELNTNSLHAFRYLFADPAPAMFLAFDRNMEIMLCTWEEDNCSVRWIGIDTQLPPRSPRLDPELSREESTPHTGIFLFIGVTLASAVLLYLALHERKKGRRWQDALLQWFNE